MKGEISRNESNAATLAVSHAVPLLVCVVVYAVIAVLSVMMCSCGGKADSNLKTAVALANSMCPYDYGNGTKLESIKYDESRNEATMTLAVYNEDENLDIEYLKSNGAVMKNQLSVALSQDKNNQWLKELAKAGASFKVAIKGLQSGKSAVFTFTAEEVKEMAKGNVPQADMNQDLDSWVAMQNQTCPQDMGDGMSVTKFTREEDNVVMYVHTPFKEELDYLRDNAGDLDTTKGLMLTRLASGGVAQLMVSNGVGFVCRLFADDPTDGVDIKVTVEELRNELNQQKQK